MERKKERKKEGDREGERGRERDEHGINEEGDTMTK